MELRVRPFTWQERLLRQRMLIAVNDVLIGEFTADRQGVLKAQIPWTVLAARTPATLTLSLPDAARPTEVQGTQDKRQLAFAFERLRLVSSSAAPNENIAADPRTEAVGIA